MENISLNLECKLTSKELQQKGEEMAEAVLRYKKYEDEKKAIAADLKTKMDTLYGHLEELAEVTKSKKEYRPVEVRVELNVPKDGTKRLTRLDTKEVIKEMPMTLEESQQNLFADSIEEINKMFGLPSPEDSKDEAQ